MKIGRITIALAVACLIAQAAAAQTVIFGTKGYLGVEIRDVTQDDVSQYRLGREAGVVVERVEEGSAAEAAGLQEGDVILEYSGIAIISVRQFQRLVSETPLAREVDIEVNRNGSRQTVRATLGERRSDRRNWLSDNFKGFDAESFSVPEFNFERLDNGTGSVVISTSRPRLGISGVNLTEQMADHLNVPSSEGVLVMEVRADSPADKAGLKAGDVIVSINGRDIDSPLQLSRRLRNGTQEIEIYRSGKSMTLEVDVESKRRSRSGRRL